jgi:hypothetical protein
MKFIILISSLAFFWLAQWHEFSSLEGRFKVLAPGKMVEKVDTSETAIGKLAYHVFFYQPAEEDADNLFYAVHYCQYPEGMLSADTTGLIEDFFESTMESAAESVGGEVMYSNDIQLDNIHPGKLWRIDFNGGKAVVKSKAYVVNDRFYMVQTVSKQEKNINLDAEKFLDSFKVF